MRWLVNSGVLVIGSLATPLLAQITLDCPIGERQPYLLRQRSSAAYRRSRCKVYPVVPA